MHFNIISVTIQNMRALTIEKKYKVGNVFNYFLCSDLHMESPEHDRKLLVKELDYAVKKEADIFFAGDIFEFLMNGDRKRFSPSKEKYYGEDAHINFAIDEAFEVLKPYGPNIKAALCGNHETSVMKHHSIDPVALLIDRLNELPDTNIEYLGYSGYIRVRYTYEKGNHCQSFDIYATHGTGGGAVITKGTIGVNRQMTAHIANLYWSGHTHTKLVLPDDVCSYLDQNGVIKHKSRKGLITGAYVLPVHHEETKLRGKAKPYHVSYGDQMRTLQSSGGMLVEHEFTAIKEPMTVRIIS